MWHSALRSDNMGVTTIRSPIVILKGPNYEQWRHQVSLLLKAQDLWDVVCGALPKPADELEDSSWKMMNAQAETLIIQTIDDPNVEIIEFYRTAKEMWDGLESLYGCRSACDTSRLWIKFYSVSLQDGQNYVEFFLEVKKISNILLDMGENLSEEMIVMKILSKLPEKLAALKEKFCEAPEDSQTMAHLYKKLEAEDQKQVEIFERNSKGRRNGSSHRENNSKSLVVSEEVDSKKIVLVEWSYDNSFPKDTFALQDPQAVNGN